jgi:hypothetical protein
MATTKKAAVRPSKAPAKPAAARSQPPRTNGKAASAGAAKRPPAPERAKAAEARPAAKAGKAAAAARPAAPRGQKRSDPPKPTFRSTPMSEATKPSDQGGGNARNRTADAVDAGGGNLEKVRDILFGAQLRDTDKRFSRLEERLAQDLAELREDTRKRFDALESFVRSELESLSQRLKTEQSERVSSARELTNAIKETTDSIGARISALDEETSERQRELRQQILEQSKSLSEDLRQRSEQLTTTLNREVRDLQTEKTDRAALAALFTEMAMRLNNEFHFPGED